MFDSSQMQKFYEVNILHPKSPTEVIYRFESEIIETNEKEIISTRIIRTVAICFLGMENNLWQYELMCLDYEIIAEHLGYKTILKKRANVFNDVVVAINQNGAIVSVLNLIELQQRWQIAKEELLEKHEGGNLLNFLENTHELVANEQSILQFVTSKDMYGLYFNSLWGCHDIRKPRFDGLTISIEKRIQEDMHAQHLQKVFSQDAVIEFHTTTQEKIQESEFTYKNQQLQEAFLSIRTPNINSKYSIQCLKP